jgi:hypothetical protein
VVVIVMLAFADLVVSVTEVAVTVTVFAAFGAVYAVVAVLPALLDGSNEPQLPLGAHVQVTPALVESFATTAVKVAFVLAASEVGGELIDTVIGLVGGGLLPLPPPQALSSAVKLRIAMRRTQRPFLTGSLPSLRRLSPILTELRASLWAAAGILAGYAMSAYVR